MADSTEERNPSAMQNCDEGQHLLETYSSLSEVTAAVNYIDNLPTELVELILQWACVACCSDKRNESEKAFGTLSSVCERWQLIVNNPTFRQATMNLLFSLGFAHSYYKKPPYVPISTSTSGSFRDSSFFSLDGDLYSLKGAYWCTYKAEDGNNPFELRRYTRKTHTAEELNSPTKPTTSKQEEYIMHEKINITVPKPTVTDNLRRRLISTEWCERNRSLYLGYLYATNGIVSIVPSAPYVCLRLSSNVWKTSSTLFDGKQQWPIRSDGVAAWTLPSLTIRNNLDKVYCLRVSNRTGNVTVIDNVNRRLINYDENGNPLGVVLVPKMVEGLIENAAEVVTSGDNIQIIVQFRTSTRMTKIVLLAVDCASGRGTIPTDVDSCLQYEAQLKASYEDQLGETHVSYLLDVDDNGLIAVILQCKFGTLRKHHGLVVLHPDDLKPIGLPILFPFWSSFCSFRVDSDSGNVYFDMNSYKVANLYCCHVRPAIQRS